MVKKPAKASRFLLEINLPSPAPNEPGFVRLPRPWQASADTDGPEPSAAIPWSSLAEEMATFLAEARSPCRVLTRVADFEAFSVVGMIRRPTEIDFVPAAGDGQRGRVVPTQGQEQWTLARGTCRDGGNEEPSGLTHGVARGPYVPGCSCRRNGHPMELQHRSLHHEAGNGGSCSGGFSECDSQRRHMALGKTRVNKAQLIAARPGFCSRQNAVGLKSRRETPEHQHSTCILRLVTKLQRCEY